MSTSETRINKCAAVSAMVLALTVFSGGCSSGGDGSPPAVPVGFQVAASPAARNFPGPSLLVSLEVLGKTDPNPVIHYTTDLAEPTSLSPIYAGPFSIRGTTVVKAIAINANATESDVLVQGYVLADNPYRVEWAASGHGDITAEAFRHWDDDGEVRTSCARCHGDGGLKDYAADGIVDVAGGLGMGHDCDICHAPVSLTIYDWRASYPFIDPVEFPSAETADLYGQSNICIACHQGRESGSSVDDDIAATPGGPYTFINIHYYAAGATYFGAETHGGYEYAGKEYAGRNSFPSHDVEQQSCVGCHMRGARADHRLEPLVSDCNGCHAGSTFETLSGTPSRNYQAIHSSQPRLLTAIQGYATGTLGFPIAYDAHNYPYFVHDLNGNGVADANELGFGNRYDEFDETLLKAAYNYQVAAKEPAGYIHNGVYIRQLINDSIEDLGQVPNVPAPGRDGFNLAQATKSEQWHMSGHSDSTAEAFRHWDDDGEVSASCARCHTSTGFIDYIEDGTVSAAGPLGETVGCSACHNSTNLFADDSTRHDTLLVHTALEPVAFPSGATGSLGDASNLCMSCHQGRESGVSVQNKAPNSVVQTPADYDSYDFVNRHYYAAGAILFGSDVTASYEYAGMTYAGLSTSAGQGGDQDTCLSCHLRGAEDHTFEPKVSDCVSCHLGITEFEELGLANGMPNVDYDGDGSGESFDAEIVGQLATLYAAIQEYARVGLPQSSPIIYVPGSYPYWFKDTDGNGELTPGENSYGNRYRDFDDELLRAVFNYHSAKDPCSDMHNYRYTLQTIYDSGDVLDNGMLDGSLIGTRP